MRQIMVATDFSARSDRALRRAVLTAHAIGAELTLVHVVDNDQPPHLVERQRGAAAELLDQMADTLTVVDQISSRAIVTEGEAFHGILQVALDVEPYFVVMGAHRRQLLDTFTGTTAQRVMQRSQFPVLMANAVPSGPYSRALLGIAFDDSSRSAVLGARRLGILEDTDLVALHLFDAPAAGLMRRAMEPQDAVDQYLAREEKQANAELLSFLKSVDAPHARLVVAPLKGSAASAIREHSEAEHADLIVLGTSQRTGLERMFLGSVAQGVLLDAAKDVLVVPRAFDNSVIPTRGERQPQQRAS